MKTNKYLTMAVTALMMAACSSEDVPQVDSVTNTPIRIHAMVAELESRAGYGGIVLPDIFYLSVANTNNPTYSYPNVQVTKSGSGWEPALPMYWQNSTTPVTVTAATFPLTVTEAQDLAVQTDQSTEANVIASDHLCMAATSQYYAEVKTDDVVTKATGAINVNFFHHMSKVNLTITLADEFDAATNPISDVTFQGTVASRKYNAGTWSDITDVTATDITAYAVGYTKPTATYEVILVPQTVTAGKFAVQFQIGGRQFKWTSTDEVNLVSGTKYTLALTAGDEKVSGASFSSAAWGNGGNNNVATE